MTDQPVLQAHGIRMSFGNLRAVNGVSLDVARGTVVGLLGPNGSGKSTFFDCVSGIVKPDSGRVVLAGRDVTGQRAYKVARAGMGRTFQIATPFASMSVLENMLVPEMVGGGRDAEHRAWEILQRLTLDRLADEPADSLSGGQMKLLDFARLLMWAPKVVLLDEIGAGVHPKLKDVMIGAIRRYQEDGIGFLLVEHDMDFVQKLCNEVYVMALGEVIARGTFDQIVQDPKVIDSYLGAEVGV